MNILIVDIGNTWTKIGVYVSGQLVKVLSSRDEPIIFIQNCLNNYNFNDFYISTVRPVDEISEIIPSGQDDKFILSHTSRLPFRLLYKTPRTLGKDRIAAVAGAWSTNPEKNHLVIDAGTCITYDWINSNGEYLGGNIAPGLNMRLRAMDEFTHQLPLGKKYDPINLWGQSTNEALYNGAAFGIIHEIESYYHKFSNRECELWITGGDGEWISKQIELKHQYNNVLVLKGLYEIYKYNH